MKSTFFYENHSDIVAGKIKNYIHSNPVFLTKKSITSPRAVGNTLEKIISERFESFLGKCCKKYSLAPTRKSLVSLS